MQNVKSTIAMKVAHKIQKTFPKMSFKACLTYAWKIVKANTNVAVKIITGVYTVKVKEFSNKFVGTVKGITCAPNKMSFKDKVKNMFTKEYPTIDVNLWAQF